MKYLFKSQSNGVLESRLQGTQVSEFLGELFSNSGHFLILKSLADIILYGGLTYISDPTEYLLIAAMLAQTWYLSRPNCHRFWGNLVGVSLYTIIDLPVDGLQDFLHNSVHLVFGLFSLILGTLQGIRFHWVKNSEAFIIPLEGLVRTFMVVAFYIVVNLKYYPEPSYFIEIQNFLTNPHWFLIWSMGFIGLLLGLKSLQITQQQKQLKDTAKLLGNMAEWGMGSYVVSTALSNPDALSFQKIERTILFMDIRGFTAWCEKTSASEVAAVINDYYRQLEPIATQYQPLRITLTADEVMVIYATPTQGVAAAKSMQKAADGVLKDYNLGAGCAVHCGNVIEGLFGSENVRTYTVIGDVVNTAKRLESATPAGEITISDPIYQTMKGQLNVQLREPIVAKGKTNGIKAWRLIV